MGTEGHALGMTGHGRRWGAHCLFAPEGLVTQDIWVFCTCCSITLPHHLVHSREARIMEQASLTMCSWPKWGTQLDSGSLRWPQHLFPGQGGLTCQRLRARRNLSCLVLMKWASSAGTDFCSGREVTVVTRDGPGGGGTPGMQAQQGGGSKLQGLLSETPGVRTLKIFLPAAQEGRRHPLLLTA